MAAPRLILDEGWPGHPSHARWELAINLHPSIFFKKIFFFWKKITNILKLYQVITTDVK